MGGDAGDQPNQQERQEARDRVGVHEQERERAAGGPRPAVEPPHISRKPARASYPPGSMSVRAMLRQLLSGAVPDLCRSAIFSRHGQPTSSKAHFTT